jgi:hypothetical protein
MDGGVEEVHEEGEGLPDIGVGATTCLLPLLIGVVASAVAGSPPPAAPCGKCMKFAPAKKNPGSVIVRVLCTLYVIQTDFRSYELEQLVFSDLFLYVLSFVATHKHICYMYFPPHVLVWFPFFR